MVSLAVSAVGLCRIAFVSPVVFFTTSSTLFFVIAVCGFMTKAIASVTLVDVHVGGVPFYFQNLTVKEEASCNDFIGYTCTFHEGDHGFVGCWSAVVIASQWCDSRDLEVAVYIVLFLPSFD
jgi:hypothetical protein